MRLVFALTLGLLFILPSACGLKTQSSGKSQKYFQSYYMGTAGTTYFIKPIWFNGSRKTEQLSADFTFRYKNSDTVAFRINLTLILPIPIKEIDSIKIESGGKVITLKHGELMFNELVKSGYLSRFGFEQAPLSALRQHFLHHQWQWTVFSQDKTLQFSTKSSKSQKAIIQTNRRLMVLVN